MNVNKELESAFRHHQAGNLKQALLIYSKILRKHPNNFNASHMLGILYGQLDNYDLAINYIEKALQVNPNSANANFKRIYYF